MLSGNRNFEGRINSEVRANYLMSPPLVVAFALAGRIDLDLRKDPIGKGQRWQAGLSGGPVAAAARSGRDDSEIDFVRHVHARATARSIEGDDRWRGLPVPKGETYAWEEDSTYIRRAPYFDDMTLQPAPVAGHQERARAGRARRQRHHRPHFSRGLDQERQPGRKISASSMA